MLSYKSYKLYQESIGSLGAIPLGISSPSNIGIGSNVNFTTQEIEQTLEEAKKKCSSCKKMLDGDEEEVSDVEEKDIKKVKDGEEVEEKDVEEKDKEVEDKDGEEVEDSDEEEGEDEEEDKEIENKKPTLFQKKKMKKEDAEFFARLSRQLSGGRGDEKHWDGISDISEKTKRGGISDNYPDAYVRGQYTHNGSNDAYFYPISANAPGKLQGKMGS